MTIVFKESRTALGYSVIPVDLETVKHSGLAVEGSRWCLWSAKWDAKRAGDKPAKIPCNRIGDAISVKDPSRWCDFGDVATSYDPERFEGVGLLMGSFAEIPGALVGLDLDKCLAVDGSVEPDASGVVADFLALGGYVEYSPSGRGLRQFLKGVRLDDFKEKCKINGVYDLEVYDPDSDRYLTVTGVAYPEGANAGAVVFNQAALEAFIVKWCERRPEPLPLEFDSEKFGGVQRSAAEVLKLMKTYNQRGRITRLLAGNTADYGGHSEADAALCFDAAYFCRDPLVIDEIVRGSGLMRPKWDGRRGRETYGSLTVRNALEAQTRNFDADKARKQDEGQVAKANAQKLAAKGAENLIGGLDGLTTAKGTIKHDLYALSELLIRDKRLLGCMYYDEFAQMPILTRSLKDAFDDDTAPSTVGRMTDPHLLAVVVWFAREWAVALRPKEELPIVARWAQKVPRNPLAEKLVELESGWDGRARLNEWLITYCRAKVTTDDGADISEYVRAVGLRWVLSAVARAMHPGCKADSMLVMEGKQGARKSSAVRALAEALGSEYFREGYSLGAGSSKDDRIALRGKLIIEWAELSGLGKRDRNEIKNFLTLQTDSYRSPWGMVESDWPRTAIFAGTTNDSAYLSDSTGNRRFWPVTVRRIDLDGLRRDAGQLWGEAVAIWRQGHRHWFDDHDPRDINLLRMAESEQFRRVGGSVWAEAGADIAERLVSGMLPMLEGEMIALRSGNFSVEQMRYWLGGNSEGAARIDDGAWIRATEGLRIAGWESTTINGRKRWRLTTDRLEELCRVLHVDSQGAKSMTLIAAEHAAAQALAVAKGQRLKVGQTQK